MLRTTLSKAKILIVDDEQANIRLLERILELIGATRVQSTSDSREAMSIFWEFRPDLVLLDLHMPNVNGFEIMEQIKARGPKENPVPVLVLTADITTKTKHRALAAGAKDFLTKPIDQSEVLLRIRNLLENRFLHIELQSQNILLEEQVRERTAQLEDTLSKLRLAQQTAIKQERLSALGTMAAGIAHDFNNALTLILGYSDLLLTSIESGPDCAEGKYVRIITTAAQDASQIVRRLREFHRPDDGAETRVGLNLNQLVEQAVTMTRPKWKEQARERQVEITVCTELSELQPILGDPAELREMLTNLVFNAVDAMPLGGSITIATRLCNDEVCLDVADTGTGMNEEVRRRCLEPFFTTKGDRGTGLGLSAVYGIIQRHGGTIDIESEKGRGTKFCIRLPALIPVGEVDGQKPPGNAKDGSRTFKILVVDDQPLISDVVQAQLQEDGHTVDTAEDGAKALARFHENGPYDLIITDQSMPGMTGEELAREVKKVYPRTPVILLTGFGGGSADDDRPAGIDLVLGKPTTLIEMRRALFQVTVGAEQNGNAAAPAPSLI
jgi:signal transduction histidine kinase